MVYNCYRTLEFATRLLSMKVWMLFMLPSRYLVTFSCLQKLQMMTELINYNSYLSAPSDLLILFPEHDSSHIIICFWNILFSFELHTSHINLCFFENQGSPLELDGTQIYVEERRANAIGSYRGGSMFS